MSVKPARVNPTAIQYIESKSSLSQALSTAGIATRRTKPPRTGSANFSAPNGPPAVMPVRESTATEDLLNVITSCRRLSNASVQLQALYNHRGEAASEKCLSAATFVRPRPRRSHSVSNTAVGTHPQCKSVNSTRRRVNRSRTKRFADSSNAKPIDSRR